MSRIETPTSELLQLDLQQVAELVGGRVEGDGSLVVTGIAPIEQAGPQELGFLAQRRYLRYLSGTGARAVLVSQALAPEVVGFQGRVVVSDAHRALPPLLERLYPAEHRSPEIHPTAVLGRHVRIGNEVRVGPYAVLEEGVIVGDRVEIGAHAVLGRGSSVGDDSTLHPHVVLYPGTRVGSRVILHAGVRLGVDGFGYVAGEEEPLKVPQVGQCVLEDGVEIGANSCVDRGSIGRTVVGRGSKLDNLVHLAHNVQVGRSVMMAAMVGVAGSSRVGDGALLGGQVGVSGHLEVGPGAQLAAQAGVIGDIPPGEMVSGYPARNHRDYLRAMGLLFKLPTTLRRLEELEARIGALEKDEER